MKIKPLLITLTVIILAVIVVLAVRPERDLQTASDAPKGKVAVNTTVEDGEQYGQIVSVNQNPEDTTVTYMHVTYFTGDEARLSAQNEVECTGDIESCVPSLTNGYYVRASGAPDVTAPVPASANITLKANAKASRNELASYIQTSAIAPVFVITIKDGQVSAIREL